MAQIYVNSDLVKPKAIHVYNDSAQMWLENKIGYVRVGGEWIPFIQYIKNLYDYGLEGTTWTPYFRQIEPNLISKNTNHLHIETGALSFGQSEGGFISEWIDLSGYSKIFVEWENKGANNSNNVSWVRVIEDRVESYVATLSKSSNFTKIIDILDIDTITGYYRISVAARKHSTDGTGRSSLNVYKIWLE